MFLWVVVESPSQEISAFTQADRYTHVCVMRWQAVADEEAGPRGRGAGVWSEGACPSDRRGVPVFARPAVQAPEVRQRAVTRRHWLQGAVPFVTGEAWGSSWSSGRGSRFSSLQ